MGGVLNMEKSLCESLLQFFAYDHLPQHLQEHSKPFHDLAHKLFETLPHNYQLSFALMKLIEAKDCAVRSSLLK